MVLMVMMMVTMKMIKMKTLEENVQNKARCSPMWAARPVLPPASGQILLPSFFFSDFEDTSKMGRLSDYEDDVLTTPPSLQEEDDPDHLHTDSCGIRPSPLALNSPFVSLTGFGF